MLSSISRLSSLTGSSSRALNLSLRPLSLIKLTSPKKEEEHPSKKFNFHTISSTLTSTSLSTPNITSLSAVRYFSLKKEDENLKIKEDNNIKINENSDNNMVEKKKSIKEKFVSLWKKYGMVFVTTYFTIYFSTIGGMFFALEYNIIPLASFGINPENLIEKFISVFSHFLPGENISSWLKNYPELATFAIAWGLTKFTEPLRFAATLFVVPRISRALGRKEIDESDKKKID